MAGKVFREDFIIGFRVFTSIWFCSDESCTHTYIFLDQPKITVWCSCYRNGECIRVIPAGTVTTRIESITVWDWVHNCGILTFPGLHLNFQGHLSRWTSEIENLPVLREMTPLRAIIYAIIFLIMDLSCWTSVIIIQPVRGAIFQNFYLSRMVKQSLKSSPDSLTFKVAGISPILPWV